MLRYRGYTRLDIRIKFSIHTARKRSMKQNEQYPTVNELYMSEADFTAYRNQTDPYESNVRSSITMD